MFDIVDLIAFVLRWVAVVAFISVAAICIIKCIK